MLFFCVLFFLASLVLENKLCRCRYALTHPLNVDCLLQGNNMTVVHYHPQQPQNSVALDMEVPLFEVSARNGFFFVFSHLNLY